MLLSLRKNGLTSLFKGVRVFKALAPSLVDFGESQELGDLNAKLWTIPL